MQPDELEEFNAAIQQAQAGQRAAAHAVFRRLAQRHPNDLAVWLWLAFSAPDLEQSALYIEQADRCDPANPALAQARGWLAEQRRAAGLSARPAWVEPAAAEPVRRESPPGEAPRVAPPSPQAEERRRAEQEQINAQIWRRSRRPFPFGSVAIAVVLVVFSILPFWLAVPRLLGYMSLSSQGARMGAGTGEPFVEDDPLQGTRYYVGCQSGYVHYAIQISENTYKSLKAINLSRDITVIYLPKNYNVSEMVGDEGAAYPSLFRLLAIGLGLDLLAFLLVYRGLRGHLPFRGQRRPRAS